MNAVLNKEDMLSLALNFFQRQFFPPITKKKMSHKMNYNAIKVSI